MLCASIACSHVFPTKAIPEPSLRGVNCTLFFIYEQHSIILSVELYHNYIFIKRRQIFNYCKIQPLYYLSISILPILTYAAKPQFSTIRL